MGARSPPAPANLPIAASRRRAAAFPYVPPRASWGARPGLVTFAEPPDHGAAGSGSVIDLRACFAAPLAPLFAHFELWWIGTWVGWVPSPVSPPPLGPPRLGPFPRLGGVRRGLPRLLLLRSPHPWPMPVAQANATFVRLH